MAFGLGRDMAGEAAAEPGRSASKLARLCWSMPRVLFFFQIRAFQLDDDPAMSDDEGEEGCPAYSEWTLPNRVSFLHAAV